MSEESMSKDQRGQAILDPGVAALFGLTVLLILILLSVWMIHHV